MNFRVMTVSVLMASLLGCQTQTTQPTGTVQSVAIIGNPSTVFVGRTANLEAVVTVTGGASAGVVWTTLPLNFGAFQTNAGNSVTYTAPSADGEVQIIATSVADPNVSARVVLRIATLPAVRLAFARVPTGESLRLIAVGRESGALALSIVDNLDGETVALTSVSAPDEIAALLPASVAGGLHTLEVRERGVQIAALQLEVLGDIDRNSVLLSVVPGVAESLVRTKIAALGYSVSADGFVPLGGGGGICDGFLVRVGLGGRTVAEALGTLSGLENADGKKIVVTADPEAKWKADPASLWSTGNVSLLADYYRQPLTSDGLGGEGVTIAVLDTGVNPQNLNQLLPGKSFVEINGSVTDDFINERPGHGSWIAEMAAGSGAGVASGATILPVKVCDANGRCLASRVLRGICYALSSTPNPKKLVLNLSLGGDTAVAAVKLALSQALLPSVGALVAVAVGNEVKNGSDGRGVSKAHYPASFNLPGMLIVGSVFHFNNPESWDIKTDPWRRAYTSRKSLALDLVAPGMRIPVQGDPLRPDVTFDLEFYAKDDGTSFATALVSGALAVWRGVCPNLSAVQLESKLKARAIKDGFFTTDPREVGAGLVQVGAPTAADCVVP